MERGSAAASVITACVAMLLFMLFPNVLSFSEPFWTNFLSVFIKQQPILQPNSHDWNILYHLGGNGPWIPRQYGVANSSIDPAPGCRVDQIHMVGGAPGTMPRSTLSKIAGMLALHDRIKNSNITLQGDLAFANNWDFFSTTPAEHFESLVSTGPYAGTLGSFSTGVKLRTRYQDLLKSAVKNGKVSFWASDSERVVETARYFAAGFFGIDWTEDATLHVIPETADRGADTLTPGRTCLRYRENADDHGHDYGYRMMDKIRSVYEPDIVHRLAEQNPHFLFSEDEIFTMQSVCGFETIARGESPWCDVFTHDEMLSMEYARDVIHYYRAGPGNPYGASLGWLWLNATANLLREGQSAGPLFFSFVHDGDIVPLLAALDVPPQEPQLPTTYVLHNRTWRTSDVVPMGGRLIFERLSCATPPNCWSNAPFYPNHIYCKPQPDEIFVRLNINDAIVAIPGCDDGPDGSCSLDLFLYHVANRGSEIDEFRYACGLPQDAPDRIGFLHQGQSRP